MCDQNVIRYGTLFSHHRDALMDASVKLSSSWPSSGHDADDASVMAMLCFDRLRWPWQLSDAARDAYRDFLKTNTGRVLTRLLKAQDTEGIKVLLALDVMDTDAFAEGAALAAKADNAEAAALLADAEHKKRAAAPQKKRYDFDF